jgi:hypothetical protein
MSKKASTEMRSESHAPKHDHCVENKSSVEDSRSHREHKSYESKAIRPDSVDQLIEIKFQCAKKSDKHHNQGSARRENQAGQDSCYITRCHAALELLLTRIHAFREQ